MALFGLKKEKKDEKKAAKPKAVKAVKAEKPAVVSPTPSFQNLTPSAILRPHITEKAGVLSQAGVYTFVVEDNATKRTVADAIRAHYKVSPVKVGIVNLPSKSVFVRGKRGIVSGMKKAVVTLKKGDKIDFV